MSVKKLNSSDFVNEVLKNSCMALVDFYADWCGPCRMVSPIVDEIAQERSDILVGKVNVDESPDLAAAFNVVNIPTLIVLKTAQKLPALSVTNQRLISLPCCKFLY